MPREVRTVLEWGNEANRRLAGPDWIRTRLTHQIREQSWPLAQEGWNLDLRTIRYENVENGADPANPSATALAYHAYPASVPADRRGQQLSPRTEAEPETTTRYTQPNNLTETPNLYLDWNRLWNSGSMDSTRELYERWMQGQSRWENANRPDSVRIPRRATEWQAQYGQSPMQAVTPDPALVETIRQQMQAQGLMPEPEPDQRLPHPNALRALIGLDPEPQPEYADPISTLDPNRLPD